MKTLKTLKTLTAIFILLAAVTSLQAQSDKIRIILHQPPPNLMGVANLWDLSLENTSGADMKIYLIGTASEDKDGLIIEGKSKVFTIKPGKTSYKYNDFSNAEVKYNNGRYKEIILRTGNAPEGSYTICVTAYNESGEVMGQENCITQNVQQTGSLSLISPSDGEEIDPDTLPGLMFMWTPSPKGGPYHLKIVELKGDQSPDVAIKESRPILDKEGITMTTFQYSSSGIKFEAGKKYAWMVKSGDTQSEVWSFSMMSSQYQIIVDTVIIKCDSLKQDRYYYWVKVRNNNPLGSPGPTNTANAMITATSPTATPITPSLLTPYSVSYPNTVTIAGTITLPTGTTSVQFAVKLEDGTQPALYNATTPYSVNLPNCNKNCCKGVIKQITQTLNSTANGLTVNFNVGPTPIKKVQMNLVYVNSKTDKNCPVCKNYWIAWGNFLCLSIFSPPCPLGGFGGLTSSNIRLREVTWEHATGVDMYNTNRTATIGILLDPVIIGGVPNNFLRCCKTDVEYCVRYSFTDTSCVTCDTVICSKVTYGGTSIPSLDTTRHNFKMIEEQLKQNQIEREMHEEKREGESQGYHGEDNPTNETRKSDSVYFDEESYRQSLREDNASEEDIKIQINEVKKRIEQIKQGTFFQIREETGEIQPRSINQPCTNGGFELGNLSSWDGLYGSSINLGFGPVPPGLPGITITYPNTGFLSPTYSGPVGSDSYWGQHVLMPNSTWAPAGVDPILISSSPSVSLPVIPPSGGTRSLRLGNPYVNRGSERISQTFLVSSQNFSFRYAAVIQRSHSNADGSMSGSEGYFVARILDMGGNELFRLNQVGYPNNIFTQSTICTGYGGLPWSDNTIYYVDWTCVNVPLGSSYVGQNVTVEFSTADCSGGAHFAYAYIDEICGTQCTGGNNYGSNGINSVSSQCAPLRICGSYDPPVVNNVTGTLSSITLTLYRYGIPVTTYGPFTPTINAAAETYCFDLNPSMFPGLTAANDGFDIVTTVNFTIGSGTHSVASGSPVSGYKPGQNNDIKILCKNCCTDFNKKVTSNISTNNTLNVSFSAGPKRIKRIIAEITDFSVSYNDPNLCAPCIDSSEYWGNFYVPNPSAISVHGLQGKPTVPVGSGLAYSREIVWGSLYGTGINMNSPSSMVAIKLSLPPKHKSSCCADTIKFCIRYKFTDTSCVMCDTLVCYKIVRSAGVVQFNDNIYFEKDNENAEVTSNTEENPNTYENVDPNRNSNGESAGLINLDVKNTSNVKITVYNTLGEIALKVYDDYLSKGNYVFDLKNYNLPDGVYFYKIENDDVSKYEKVLITRPTSGCNCGKK